MSQISFPLENTDYMAEDAQLWFSARTSGVYSSDNDLPVTSVGGMRIAVGAGMAWLDWARFKGVVYANTDTVNFDLAQADGALSRIDRVVVRYDIIGNTVALAVKQGVFSTSPIVPALQRDSSVYEIALADVHVNRGVVEITQADIFDQRLNEDVCGVMRDGVTRIPTAQLQAQWDAWLARIADIPLDEELAQWLVARMLKVEEDFRQLTEDFEQFTEDIDAKIVNTASSIGWRLLTEYNTPGTFQFKLSDFIPGLDPDILYEIGAYEVGAGGSGAVATGANSGASGGGSGYTKHLILKVLPEQVVTGVIGAGGAAIVAAAATPGNTGGTTSFGGYTAEGGEGGKVTAFGTGMYLGARGGQGSEAVHGSSTATSRAAMGEIAWFGVTQQMNFGQGATRPSDALNLFDNKKYLAAGGLASAWRSISQLGATAEDGSKGGNGSHVANGTAGIGRGSGGGAAARAAVTTISSGAGANGAVLIYIRRAV